MDFSFVQITDHHLTSSETELVKGYSTRFAFRTVLAHIAKQVGEQIDFIVSTGDLVDIPDEASYRALLQLVNGHESSVAAPGPVMTSFKGMEELPLYLLPGNHDDRENFFKCLFPKTPPMLHLNAAFVHKDVQFICLDWGPDTKAIAHPEMLGFLDQSLKTNLPSVLLMHHHLVPVGSRWLDGFIAEDIDRFWETVRGHAVLGIFCGHAHTSYDTVMHGIPIFGLRSTSFPFVLQDEPLGCLLPPHYRLVMIRDGVLTTRIFEVPL